MENIIKQTYGVLKPLINKVLFQNFDEPDFKEVKNVKLNTSFVNLINTKRKKENLKLSSIYLFECLTEVFSKFTEADRLSVVKILLHDIEFKSFVMFKFLLGYKNINPEVDLTADDIQDMILLYGKSGKMNAFVALYFDLFFEDIFNFKFSESNTITEKEYQVILDQYLQAKTLV